MIEKPIYNYGTPERQLVYAYAEEIERLRSIEDAARNLAALWLSQKVAGLPRAERNAAIEASREQLIVALGLK